MHYNKQNILSLQALASSWFSRILSFLLIVAIVSLSSCSIIPAEDVVDDILEEVFYGEVSEAKTIDEIFATHILESELFQAFVNALMKQEMAYSLESSFEVIYKNMPEQAMGKRTAIIPVKNYTREGSQYFLQYSYDPISLEERLFLAETLPGEEGYRFYTQPDLLSGFDWTHVPGENTAILASFGDVGDFVACVLERLVLWGALNPAMIVTCGTACSAGFVGNPACQLCIAGAAIYLAAAIWVCS